ncbi:MAG: hypothetical protein KIT56_02125 [Gammaproteobacteria bacterium]|nr:hypothetical protein [Gammaproteobacteria bacterium]
MAFNRLLDSMFLIKNPFARLVAKFGVVGASAIAGAGAGFLASSFIPGLGNIAGAIIGELHGSTDWWSCCCYY